MTDLQLKINQSYLQLGASGVNLVLRINLVILLSIVALDQQMLSASIIVDESQIINGSLVDKNGNLVGSPFTDKVKVRATATINILLGTFEKELKFKDTSTGNILGGVFEYKVKYEDSSSGQLTGGEFQHGVVVKELASLLIFGGMFTDKQIKAKDSAFIEIYGGSFQGINKFKAEGTAVINVFGESFSLPFGTLSGKGTFSGTLSDGTTFTDVSYKVRNDAAINLVEYPSDLSTPEPTSLLIWSLLGCVALIARRRRRNGTRDALR